MKVQHGSWKPDSAAILVVRPFQHTTLKTLIILFKQLQQNIFPKNLRVNSSSMKGMFLWYKANGPWCGRAAVKAQNCQSQGCYNQRHPEPAASAQENPHCSASSPQLSPALGTPAAIPEGAGCKIMDCTQQRTNCCTIWFWNDCHSRHA